MNHEYFLHAVAQSAPLAAGWEPEADALRQENERLRTHLAGAAEATEAARKTLTELEELKAKSAETVTLLMDENERLRDQIAALREQQDAPRTGPFIYVGDNWINPRAGGTFSSLDEATADALEFVEAAGGTEAVVYAMHPLRRVLRKVVVEEIAA